MEAIHSTSSNAIPLSSLNYWTHYDHRNPQLHQHPKRRAGFRRSFAGILGSSDILLSISPADGDCVVRDRVGYGGPGCKETGALLSAIEAWRGVGE